jgi:hypothetical protein
MPSVQVNFGANIVELLGGIQSAISALRSFAEAVGAMYVLDKTEQFVSQFGAMALQIEKTAGMLGVSTTEIQELGIASQLSGSDQQTLITAADRLQVSLQRALVPTSQQAAALRALGLTAQQLLAVPIPEQIDLIADAMKRLHDQGINPIAPAMQLMGRGAAELAPELEKGRAGFEATGKAAVDAAAIMTTQTLAALTAVDKQSTLLDASLKALHGTITGALVGGLTGLDSELTTASANLTKLVATGSLYSYTMGYMGKVADLVGEKIGRLSTALVDLFSASPKQFWDDWEAGGKKVDDASAALMKFNTDSVHATTAAYKELLAAANDANSHLKPPPGYGGGNDAIKASAEQYQSMIKLADDSYAQLKQQYAADVAQHNISVGQETSDLERALDERWAIEQAVYARELQLYAQGSSQYNSVIKAQQQSYENYLKEREAAADAAAKQEAAVWKSAADQTAGAFNGQLLKMLEGKEAFAQASRKIEQDMVLKFLEDQVKATVEFLFNQARMLATAIATQTGMTAATTAGAAARAAAETASGQTSILSVVANALKAIFAGAGQTAAGVSANVAPVVGPPAPAIGAAAGAAVAASASALAIYDKGTDYVTQSGIGWIDEGEAIVPKFARDKGPYTGAGLGGGAGGADMVKALRGILGEHREMVGQMVAAHAKTMRNVAGELASFRQATKRMRLA